MQEAFAETVVSAGQVIVGGVESTTVILNVQVAELPAVSVAVQVTVVMPSGRAEGASFESVIKHNGSSRCAISRDRIPRQPFHSALNPK